MSIQPIHKASCQISMEDANEVAERIENAVFNTCVAIGKDSGERLIKKINDIIVPVIVHTLFTEIVEKTISVCTTSLLEHATGRPVDSPLMEVIVNIIDKPINKKIKRLSRPVVNEVSEVVMRAANTILTPFGKYAGTISGEMYAEEHVDGKLASKIKESFKPSPEHFHRGEFAETVEKVIAWNRIHKLLNELEQLGENHLGIPNISNRKYRTCTVRTIKFLDDNLSLLAFWIPGSTESVEEYLLRTGEDPLDIIHC